MLPEKWYIKRTPDTATEINKWFNTNTGKLRTSHYGILYYPDFHGARADMAVEQGYKEVTYREFLEGISIQPVDYQIF